MLSCLLADVCVCTWTVRCSLLPRISCLHILCIGQCKIWCTLIGKETHDVHDVCNVFTEMRLPQYLWSCTYSLRGPAQDKHSNRISKWQGGVWCAARSLRWSSCAKQNVCNIYSPHQEPLSGMSSHLHENSRDPDICSEVTTLAPLRQEAMIPVSSACPAISWSADWKFKKDLWMLCPTCLVKVGCVDQDVGTKRQDVWWKAWECTCWPFQPFGGHQWHTLVTLRHTLFRPDSKQYEISGNTQGWMNWS